MNKKILLVIGLTALVIVNIAVAAYYIYSNQVTVDVQEYRLQLSASTETPNLYDNITLTALLTVNGETANSGETINFYRENIPIGSNTTNEAGIALLEYNVTIAGPQNFNASYYVP